MQVMFFTKIIINIRKRAITVYSSLVINLFVDDDLYFAITPVIRYCIHTYKVHIHAFIQLFTCPAYIRLTSGGKSLILLPPTFRRNMANI